MIRKLFGVEPGALSCDQASDYEGRLFHLALDANGIRARAHVLKAKALAGDASLSHIVSDRCLDDAGMELETITEREALLAQHGMIDPALLPQEPREPSAEASQSDAEKQHDAVSLEDLRCLEALSRLERGATRKELTEHYGKSFRTIYTWLEKAKKLRLKAFEEVRPAEKLAEASHDFEMIRSDLLTSYEEAKRKGNSRAALEILRELRAWRQQDLDMWNAIGFFHQYKHPVVLDDMKKAMMHDLLGGLL
ncbi:hypothetical protein [Aquibium oceanicum]|nr:hypothetical protein [Aquibium oceanicum]